MANNIQLPTELQGTTPFISVLLLWSIPSRRRGASARYEPTPGLAMAGGSRRVELVQRWCSRRCRQIAEKERDETCGGGVPNNLAAVDDRLIETAEDVGDGVGGKQAKTTCCVGWMYRLYCTIYPGRLVTQCGYMWPLASREGCCPTEDMAQDYSWVLAR